MAKVAVEGRPLPEVLGPLLDWRFNLSSQQLRRGLVYTGAGSRWAQTGGLWGCWAAKEQQRAAADGV